MRGGAMTKFRLVTFDVTNTLLQFRSSAGEVYADTASHFKVHVDVEKANSAFRRHFKDLGREHPNFGASTGITSQTWWSEIVRRTLRDSSSTPTADETTQKISQRLFQAYSTDVHWKANPGSLPLLSRLKKSGVSLGVISNFDERLHGILDKTRLNTHFDFVIASYVVNSAKPNREIFDKALQRVSHLGISGGEALHVGDDYELDYLAACNAGWNAMLIKSGAGDLDYAVPDFPSLERKLFHP